jgi:hypothetical protein
VPIDPVDPSTTTRRGDEMMGSGGRVTKHRRDKQRNQPDASYTPIAIVVLSAMLSQVGLTSG